MKQAIHLDEDRHHYQILKDLFSTFLHVNLIHCSTTKEVLELTAYVHDINLVIIIDDDLADQAGKSLATLRPMMSLICVSNSITSSSRITRLQAPANWEDILRVSSYVLGIPMQTSDENDLANYCPLDLNLLAHIHLLPCEVYEARTSLEQTQIVQLLEMGAAMEADVLRALLEQDVAPLVKKNDMQRFLNFSVERLALKLSAQRLASAERLTLNAAAFLVIRRSAQEGALATGWRDLTSMTVASICESLGLHVGGESILLQLKQKCFTLNYQHWHLTTLISRYILTHNKLYDLKHLQTICLVACYANIYLEESHHLLAYREEDIYSSHFTPEDRVKMLTNAKKAYELLDVHPDVDDLARLILLEAGEYGAKINNGEKLTNLSQIYIVADSFTKIYLSPDLPSNKAEILPMLSARYQGPSYQKIISALEQKYEHA